MEHLRLVDLIGPMLGANFLYAEGEVLEENTALATPVVHAFWAHKQQWRVERDDGVVFIDGPEGSATLVGGRLSEQGMGRHGPGFHLPERLLRPQHAPIWGRPGEDWRLTDELETVDGGHVRVALQGTVDRHTEPGHILVDPQTGRLHRVCTPGFTWTLMRVEDEEPENAAKKFSLPAGALTPISGHAG